jgi:hypothetical protein
MPTAPSPDIVVTVSSTLLKDILDAITIALRPATGNLKESSKVRLRQFHLLAAARKQSPKMNFTLTPTILKDISECITIASARDGLEPASKSRLGTWQVEITELLPHVPVIKQERMKL